MTPLYYTKIVGGRFTSAPLRGLLSAFEGQRVEAFIRKLQEYPPEGLHRHYRGRLVPMVTTYFNGCGADRPTTAEEVHRSLTRWFLTKADYCTATDGYTKRTPSTRSLTWQQMQEFVHRVERWIIVDLELKIPDRDADFDLVD